MGRLRTFPARTPTPHLPNGAQVDLATKALAYDDKNTKVQFRRGQAYMNKQEFEKAKADFEACLRADPNSAEVKNAFITLAQKREAATQREKQLFSKMFS